MFEGRPLWTSNRSRTSEENARSHFEKNGASFGADTMDEYVRQVHAFVADPPEGTQKMTRPNGDTLLYDPKGNVFAVARKDGAPRTMFKPDDGAAYWEKQKAREARNREGGGDAG